MKSEEVTKLREELKEDLNKILIKLNEVQTLKERREEESLSTVSFDELNLLTLKSLINDILSDKTAVVDMFDEYKMSYN